MSRRAASLGMYDTPGARAANDQLWTAIAAHLARTGVTNVPPRLDRDRAPAVIWDDERLLLAQSCGYPFVTAWRDKLPYVATPRYRVAGCDGSTYRSRIVVRIDDPADALIALRDRRAALNESSSNSGMNLFRAAVAPLADGGRFFSELIATGSHVASARLVATGGADVAAIDAVSFAHLERDEPETARRLRTIGWTIASPGLPLVTSPATTARELAALREALAAVATDPALAEARALLFLDGFDILDPAAYEAIRTIEEDAIRLGYPALA
ncbi:PhnD/SsuA/transferrin family substrate-binding protein [Sphingomonas sp. BIUV-7]|uniref:PhnD/SsuA/transferrin family substrate-binding protein n=1 Tax=Sphingomonas natans TaxID=3063330 RepID=A0ABT8Y9K9_9SPHN|nr:PhnD/SsuA/transferrin family substrate-binding protein [Sphingomonas sp. BIUV-7]MDO6415023.1 PhnD/SsuA/transferrin family substrate-binding protein [Sphingomonas sp. BIUV-7]